MQLFICFRWVDVTRMEKNTTMLVPESIKISTRENNYVFSMFMDIKETHNLITQLSNMAIRQLLDGDNYDELSKNQNDDSSTFRSKRKDGKGKKVKSKKVKT